MAGSFSAGGGRFGAASDPAVTRADDCACRVVTKAGPATATHRAERLRPGREPSAANWMM
jgi:hypothetical protein